MKLMLVLMGALAGCARSSIAALVPQLEVGVRSARTRAGADSTTQLAHARGYLVLGVWLRWQPVRTDRAAGSVLSAATSITPCEPDDASCLLEQAESDPDVAADLARLGLEAP